MKNSAKMICVLGCIVSISVALNAIGPSPRVVKTVFNRGTGYSTILNGVKYCVNRDDQDNGYYYGFVVNPGKYPVQLLPEEAQIVFDALKGLYDMQPVI